MRQPRRYRPFKKEETTSLEVVDEIEGNLVELLTSVDGDNRELGKKILEGADWIDFERKLELIIHSQK